MDNVKFVPAPTTMAMLGLGLLSFAFVSRRKVRFTLQA
ncbi:PEP-CTERM sorting domain-containing protein [Bathymodiolus platifrons methanotrophic gill symbiont]